MKELDYSHHVSQIPKGAELPEYNRLISSEVSHIPDYQSAVSNYASATNWMSAVGSEVAARASNALAIRLGTESGKNPTKDHLGLSLTEFDKVYEQSYTTQAQATLGLQAQTLISKSNLEVAASPNINADMISKSQKQVALGLQRILSLAPDSVKGQMESHYGSIMLQQNEHLVSRMLKQQQEDRRNTLDLSTKVNNQNAFSLALSGAGGVDDDGNSKSGLLAVKATEYAYQSAIETRDATPLEAKVAIDSARQSYLSGKYARLAEMAETLNKLPEFYKELSDSENVNTKDITTADRQAVVNNVVEHMNARASLRMQDQQLKMSQFQVQLAENPDAITGAEFAQLQSQLTPIQSQKVKLDFVQALNRRKADNQQSNVLISDWGNSELHARAGDKVQNQTFDKLVDKVITSNNESGKMPISHDEAQIQVAASAGASIPVFTKSLQNKLSSGNPIQMEAAAQQMHALYQMNAGHALSGLTEKDKAMYGAIETLRSSLDPTEAAREATNKIYNQDPVMFKANQQKWSDYLSVQTKGGISLTDFAFSQFGYNKKDFLNTSVAQVYGTDILEKYATYYQLLSGDEVTAKSVTQRYVDENYGNTGINGGSNKTLHPLEKVLGYSDTNIVPHIQQDVINQLNTHFMPIKEAYDKGTMNEYWTTEPLSDKTHGIFSTTYDPLKVKRHTKVNGTEKVETFDVVLQGNAFDNWDVAVLGQSGLRNLYQVAPFLGVISYLPNKKAIDASYLKSFGK